MAKDKEFTVTLKVILKMKQLDVDGSPPAFVCHSELIHVTLVFTIETFDLYKITVFDLVTLNFDL